MQALHARAMPWAMLKLLLWVAALVAFVWFAVSVPLGKYTLWGHARRIWQTQETQDLVEGTKKAVAPAADKVKRAVKAGVDEARKDP
jgi:hypothetical protein